MGLSLVLGFDLEQNEKLERKLEIPSSLCKTNTIRTGSCESYWKYSWKSHESHR